MSAYANTADFADSILITIDQALVHSSRWMSTDPSHLCKHHQTCSFFSNLIWFCLPSFCKRIHVWPCFHEASKQPQSRNLRCSSLCADSSCDPKVSFQSSQPTQVLSIILPQNYSHSYYKKTSDSFPAINSWRFGQIHIKPPHIADWSHAWMLHKSLQDRRNYFFLATLEEVDFM